MPSEESESEEEEVDYSHLLKDKQTKLKEKVEKQEVSIEDVEDDLDDDKFLEEYRYISQCHCSLPPPPQ